MPTIEIETNVDSQTMQRTLAKETSVWMSKKNIEMSHCITKFRIVDSSKIYSGPYPFNKFPKKDQNFNFAFIKCVISNERKEAFKQELASIIVKSLSSSIESKNIFIQFFEVNSSDYYNGENL